MRTYLSLLFSVLFFSLCAQNTASLQIENIVPNPGFEKYSSTPIGWFYKGKHFTNVVKYWSSPTAASPDVFGPKVRVPKHWAEKGFGKQQAKQGKSMAGITLFGCEDGKPHCREYLQIQLKESLVIGQGYYAEFWVSHLPRSIQVDGMGMYFSKSEIKEPTDALLEREPALKAERIINNASSNWVKISGKFVATEEADFLIIGNFSSDSLTLTESNHYDPLNYAYYYVDQVLVKKVEPIIDVPVKEDGLSNLEIKRGKVIRLENIFFDTDRAELLPRSYSELDKLLALMQNHPSLVIEISGHTDSVGGRDYNTALSERRAMAVSSYLRTHGINSSRTLFKGYGDSRPIASNSTVEGRQLNRRVEFTILQE